MIDVNITGGVISDSEKQAYIDRGMEKYGQTLHAIDVKVDGDYVDIGYHYAAQPFERIRRITGYLVGTLNRFNNAKRAEEHDRVKHSL